MKPAHLLAEAGDRRALCGARDALPRVLFWHYPAHLIGHGLDACPQCLAVAATRPDLATSAPAVPASPSTAHTGDLRLW